MTKANISLLRSLIAEKEDRLSAIGRRIVALRARLTAITKPEELAEIAKEWEDLKAETDEALAFVNRLKKEINSFYRPAA